MVFDSWAEARRWRIDLGVDLSPIRWGEALSAAAQQQESQLELAGQHSDLVVLERADTRTGHLTLLEASVDDGLMEERRADDETADPDNPLVTPDSESGQIAAEVCADSEDRNDASGADSSTVGVEARLAGSFAAPPGSFVAKVAASEEYDHTGDSARNRSAGEWGNADVIVGLAWDDRMAGSSRMLCSEGSVESQHRRVGQADRSHAVLVLNKPRSKVSDGQLVVQGSGRVQGPGNGGHPWLTTAVAAGVA